jgi:U3 small nucleolar RNA-associated protein 14
MIVEGKNAKYGVKSLPYGYRSESEFQKFIPVPMRREENSLRMFNELVGEGLQEANAGSGCEAYQVQVSRDE